MPRKHAVLAFALLPALLSPALARPPVRQDAPASASNEAERKALETKAIVLLDQVLAGVRSLRLPSNRLRLRAAAAQLLWTRNQARARGLVRDAMGDLAEVAATIDPNDMQDYQAASDFVQLRSELLQAVAPFDPLLAREVLRATRAPGAVQAAGIAVNDSELEMGLAAQVSTRDPKQALQMAEESLERGLSPYLVSVLSGLQSSDPEAAAGLADRILTRLKSENLASNQEAGNVAISLLRLGLSSIAAQQAPEAGEAPEAARPPLLDEAALRSIVDMLTAAAQNVPTGGDGEMTPEQATSMNLLMSLQTMAAEIERFAPAAAPALRKKLGEFEQTSRGARVRAWSEFNELAQGGSVGSLMEAAEKAPAEMKTHLYQLAAQKAVGEGNIEEARRIVDEHITDPYMRSSLLSAFEQQLIQNARQASRIQEARALASRLRTKEERAMMLAQLASDVSGDKNLALQLLDEARDQIGPRAETATQFNVQLQLVQMYAPVDPARGFRLLQPMVERLNELVAAAAVLDGFEGNQHFRDGELQINGGGTFASLAQQCGGALGALAAADFDRARLVADGLQRDEARLSARFTIAQTVLLSVAAADAGEGTPEGTIGAVVGPVPPPRAVAATIRSY